MSQSSLHSFFLHSAPKRARIEENVNVNVDVDEDIGSDAVDLESDDDQEESQCNIAEVPQQISALDIGLFVDDDVRIDDAMRYQLSQSCWRPTEDYPFEIGRTYQIGWRKEFPWLEFSHVKRGAFCRSCVLFCANKKEKSNKPLGAFVTGPYNSNFKTAKSKLIKHQGRNYHELSVKQEEIFVDVMNKRLTGVDIQLNDQEAAEIEKNRATLRSILQVIILCGRQNLALRGHREKGRILCQDESDNDGNFRALLRHRVEAGDNILKNHLETCPTNATYISPVVQNQLIAICGSMIKDKITKEANESGCFCVLADEASDINGKEVLCYAIRYIPPGKTKAMEYCLGYMHITDLSGEGLAKAIIKCLMDSGLDLSFLYGQGYDGAAAMSGCIKGVQARIRNDYPKAIFTHCASHSLNLALNSASDVLSVRHAFSTIQDVCYFFDASPKRQQMLSTEIMASKDLAAQARPNLIKLCQTRWIERQDAVERFFTLAVCIYKVLKKMVNGEEALNGKDREKADDFANRMEKIDFIFSLAMLNKLTSDLITVSANLQKPTIDLVEACRQVSFLKGKLNSRQDESDKTFEKVYMAAVVEKLVPMIGLDAIPLNRDGLPRKEYCKAKIFTPYLVDLDQQLTERFASHHKQIYSLQYLVPCHFDPAKESSRYWKEVSIALNWDGYSEWYRASGCARKFFWTLIMLGTMVSIVYYGYTVSTQYLAHPSATQMIELENGTIQFPNVTTCHSAKFNKSYVEEKINLEQTAVWLSGAGFEPDGTLYKSKQDFISWLSFLTMEATDITAQGRNMEIMYQYYFNKSRNPLAYDMVQFIEDAAMQCNELLFSCAFGAKQFDCCQNAKRVFTNYGTCYQIQIESRDGTTGQTFPGTTGGLKVWARVNRTQAPYGGNDRDVGLRAHFVDRVSLFDNPVLIPPNKNALIRIDSTLYSFDPMIDVCTDNPPSLYRNQDYTQGACAFECMQNITIQRCGCKVYGYDVPYVNVSELCTPLLMATCVMPMSSGWQDEKKDMEVLLLQMNCVYQNCPKLCQQWTYNTYASYQDVVPASKMPNDTDYYLFTAFFGEIKYTQVQSALLWDFNTFLCNVGGLIGLWTGWSVITLVQLVAYCYFIPCCYEGGRSTTLTMPDGTGGSEYDDYVYDEKKKQQHLKSATNSFCNNDTNFERMVMELTDSTYRPKTAPAFKEPDSPSVTGPTSCYCAEGKFCVSGECTFKDEAAHNVCYKRIICYLGKSLSAVSRGCDVVERSDFDQRRLVYIYPSGRVLVSYENAIDSDSNEDFTEKELCFVTDQHAERIDLNASDKMAPSSIFCKCTKEGMPDGYEKGCVQGFCSKTFMIANSSVDQNQWEVVCSVTHDNLRGCLLTKKTQWDEKYGQLYVLADVSIRHNVAGYERSKFSRGENCSEAISVSRVFGSCEDDRDSYVDKPAKVQPEREEESIDPDDATFNLIGIVAAVVVLFITVFIVVCVSFNIFQIILIERKYMSKKEAAIARKLPADLLCKVVR